MARVRKLDAYIEIIKEAYLAGASMLDLAATHKVSEGTIRNILIREGVPLNKRGRRTKGDTSC